jgi:hypothetical protein
MPRKDETVYTVEEANNLLKWHWKPLQTGRDWHFYKYERRRKVHTSVVLAMGWRIGVRGGRGAGLICHTPEIRELILAGYLPVARRLLCYLVKDRRRIPLHPDMWEAALELVQLTSRTRAQNLLDNELSSAGARARKHYALHLRKRSAYKRTLNLDK